MSRSQAKGAAGIVASELSTDSRACLAVAIFRSLLSQVAAVRKFAFVIRTANMPSENVLSTFPAIY